MNCDSPPPLATDGVSLVVDNFAGGGGASLGIETALGRPVDYAINHDAEAIAMHRANHPATRHFCESVWDVDPVALARGRPVGLGWFSPDCFPAGTMVLAREGYRPIEEIAPGDFVLTHRLRWQQVTRTMRAVRPLLRVRGHGHPGLLVSPEHPFYARLRRDVWDNASRRYERTLQPIGWTRAADLERGWYWASPARFPPARAPDVAAYRGRGMTVTANLMWLAGLYLADGWTRLTDVRAELVVTCGKHEVDRLREQLSRWARTGSRAAHDELAWVERETATACQFSTSHRGLVEWLREHFGHGAAEKRIPGWALGLETPSRAALLGGYLTGDGCVSHGDGTPLTVCTTVSKALAFGLKALASSLGHHPSVYLRETQPDVIQGRKVNVRPAWAVKWRANIDLTHAQGFEEDGLIWAAVRERTDDIAAQAEVFNLSVEEDESYIADGIVVHNCTFHSKARGGKPFRDRDRARRRRGLAWLVVRWAKAVRPRVIMLENVEEFADWGPLLPDGRPCPVRRGLTFRRWHRQLENLGYQIDMRELRACDYGAPTSRKRLFVIARCDGAEIEFPSATHGEFRGALPYRTAAECIDWSIPCPSIFTRERPLAEATLRRIARGVMRYVVNAPQPFIVPLTHQGDRRVHPIDEPAPTATGAQRGELALVAPTLINTRNGERAGQEPRVRDILRPYPTITAQGSQGALVAAFLARHYGDKGQRPGTALDEPVATVTVVDHHSLVTSHILKLKGTCQDGHSVTEPLHTVQAGGTHYGEVRAFLIKYFGTEQDPRLERPLATVTTKDRFGLVMVHGEPYAIVDIGMRMLTPRELYRAQSFPDRYIIDPTVHGKPLTKTAQVRCCGNSVPPVVAEALVRANVIEQRQEQAA